MYISDKLCPGVCGLVLSSLSWGGGESKSICHLDNIWNSHKHVCLWKIKSSSSHDATDYEMKWKTVKNKWLYLHKSLFHCYMINMRADVPISKIEIMSRQPVKNLEEGSFSNFKKHRFKVFLAIPGNFNFIKSRELELATSTLSAKLCKFVLIVMQYLAQSSRCSRNYHWGWAAGTFLSCGVLGRQCVQGVGDVSDQSCRGGDVYTPRTNKWMCPEGVWFTDLSWG